MARITLLLLDQQNDLRILIATTNNLDQQSRDIKISALTGGFEASKLVTTELLSLYHIYSIFTWKKSIM
jgi:protein subunit release factor A